MAATANMNDLVSDERCLGKRPGGMDPGIGAYRIVVSIYHLTSDFN